MRLRNFGCIFFGGGIRARRQTVPKKFSAKDEIAPLPHSSTQGRVDEDSEILLSVCAPMRR
jgi:hypothetical protein